MAGDSDNDDGAPPRPGKGAPGKSAEVKEFRAAGRGKKCPLCGGPVAVATRPFCSKRCADLDLGRWLGGDYRLPTDELPDGGEEFGPESGLESGEDRPEPPD
jgi:hypothetical protein